MLVGDDERLVAGGESGAGNQRCTEDVGVEDCWPSPPRSGHEWIAVRKASPSSGVRSSITMSSLGGSGRTRRRSSSTGSSRWSLRVTEAGSGGIS
jgi:hypothetical protein